MRKLLYTAFLGLGLTQGLYAAGDGTVDVPDFSSVADCSTAVLTLDRGLCYYDKLIAGGLNRDARVQALEQGIDALVQAQQEGLNTAQQSLASLVEGLLHCQLATGHWANKKMIKYTDPDGITTDVADSASATGFCSERTKAAGALNDVLWQHLLLNKAGDATTGDTYDVRLIKAMAQCQKEVINEFNRCEQIAPQSLDSIRKTAQAAASEQIIKSFGCTLVDKEQYPELCEKFGAAAPATAMLERKLARVSFVTDANAKKLFLLDAEAHKARQQFDQYFAAYTESLAVASQAFNTFKFASELTTNIYTEYKRWEDGLLGTEKIGEVNDKKALVTAEQAKYAHVEREMKVSMDRFKSMLVSEAEKKSQMLKLCKLYYCGIQSKFTLLRYKQACLNNQNTLCKGTITIEGTARSVADLCTDLGALKKQGMEDGEAKACLAEVVEPSRSAAPAPASATFDRMPAILQ